MKRIRGAALSVRSSLAGLAAAFRPAPGTTEGVVMLGLLLLALGFLTAGLVPWALGVPGAVLTIVGLLPALRRND